MKYPFITMLIVVLLFVFVTSCAIYYHGPDTGAEHVWGFGHLVTKVTPPADGKQTIIRQVSIAGLSVGFEDEAFGFSAGWNRRERITVYDANRSLAIQHPPSNDFLLFKITEIPPSTTIDDQNKLEKQEGKMP